MKPIEFMGLDAGDKALMVAKMVVEGEMRAHEEHLAEREAARAKGRASRRR